MAIVSKLQPMGKNLTVILSDGSRFLAVYGKGIWNCPSNPNGLKTIERYGNMLLLKFNTNATRTFAYKATNLWYVGPNVEPIPPYLWPFSLSSANIFNGQPDDGFMTPGRPTHNGMDFGYGGAAGAGNEIGVAAAGTVIAAGFTSDGYGNNVTVYHGTVSALGDLSTMYAHMQDGSLTVSVGTNVSIGQTLGLEGTTGNSTGNHLHFVTYVNGVAVDPLYFMSVVNPTNGYVRP